jgi:hypothetical protein
MFFNDGAAQPHKTALLAVAAQQMPGSAVR